MEWVKSLFTPSSYDLAQQYEQEGRYTEALQHYLTLHNDDSLDYKNIYIRCRIAHVAMMDKAYSVAARFYYMIGLKSIDCKTDCFVLDINCYLFRAELCTMINNLNSGNYNINCQLEPGHIFHKSEYGQCVEDLWNAITHKNSKRLLEVISNYTNLCSIIEDNLLLEIKYYVDQAEEDD